MLAIRVLWKIRITGGDSSMTSSRELSNQSWIHFLWCWRGHFSRGVLNNTQHELLSNSVLRRNKSIYSMMSFRTNSTHFELTIIPNLIKYLPHSNRWKSLLFCANLLYSSPITIHIAIKTMNMCKTVNVAFPPSKTDKRRSPTCLRCDALLTTSGCTALAGTNEINVNGQFRLQKLHGKLGKQ